jgi:hypothetical protein
VRVERSVAFQRDVEVPARTAALTARSEQHRGLLANLRLEEGPSRGGVVVGDAQQLCGIGVDQGGGERCGPMHRGAGSIAHIAIQHGDRFTRSRGMAVRYAERDQTGQQVVPAELTLACDAVGPRGRQHGVRLGFVAIGECGKAPAPRSVIEVWRIEPVGKGR